MLARLGCKHYYIDTATTQCKQVNKMQTQQQFIDTLYASIANSEQLGEHMGEQQFAQQLRDMGLQFDKLVHDDVWVFYCMGDTCVAAHECELERGVLAHKV